MTRFRVATDIEECRDIWQALTPNEVISDLWDARECFHRHYRRPLHFIVAEDDSGVKGLLPLCWIEESGCFGYFPGETWHGKTWLEQNRVFASDGMASLLLARCPSPRHIRYMLPFPCDNAPAPMIDEVGYLFMPPRYDYDIEKYYLEFSRKSAKRLARDLEAIASLGLTYRYDDMSDFEHIVSLNIGKFGHDSYFHDSRFTESFRALMKYLADKGMMRITAIFTGGEPAAVDLGCIYRNAYTLLAGGANPNYPGIAKFINVHHMKFACERKFDSVDFLCGDFSWKKLFHLSPRPLFMISDWQSRQEGAESSGLDETESSGSARPQHHVACDCVGGE